MLALPPSQPIVADTHIIIRGLISPGSASAKLLNAILRRQVLLATSRTHLTEIHNVLARPRFFNRYQISRDLRQRIIRRLYMLSLYVQPIGRLQLCRDPKDDYLIEMALLTKAAFLISEDNDLHDDDAIVTLLHQNNIELVHILPFVSMLSAE
jgi:putative PIN family toxin of toxin-antitoxin system